jgi:hypothetical protein
MRVITVERPGIGVSTRLPGRGVAEHADEHPDRVLACAIGDGAAPLTDDGEGEILGELLARARPLVATG